MMNSIAILGLASMAVASYAPPAYSYSTTSTTPYEPTYTSSSTTCTDETSYTTSEATYPHVYPHHNTSSVYEPTYPATYPYKPETTATYPYSPESETPKMPEYPSSTETPKSPKTVWSTVYNTVTSCSEECPTSTPYSPIEPTPYAPESSSTKVVTYPVVPIPSGSTTPYYPQYPQGNATAPGYPTGTGSYTSPSKPATYTGAASAAQPIMALVAGAFALIALA